jgi:poly(glycerol-phosphate) alpha-glucosyltransferase
MGMPTPDIRFPEANYFIASSRLRPGMDGGYTVSTLRRAAQFAEHGGVNPVLLTFDFWPDYEQVQSEFVGEGLMSEQTNLRNLLQDARREPGFLRQAAVTGTAEAELPGLVMADADLDSQGRPWRAIATDSATGAIAHTDFFDLNGQPVLRVPYVTGRADWHQAPIRITVFDADGSVAGSLDGFGGLYRAWVQHVLDTSPASLPNVVVCESRQLGELLVDLPGDNLRLVHTVHSNHTSAPYQWDSPIDGLWASWFELVDGFDAVLWLTETQRHAVEQRFGPRDNFWVVPHAVDVEPRSARERDPNLAVMIGRLVALKRLDQAFAAFRSVVAQNPKARLAIFGEGPDEQRLRSLAAELGIQRSVEFRGHRADAADQLGEAAALVLTSTYEGQPLVILEALARGCPVVSYDINFGPSDMVVDGVNGVLVADGDVAAMADALSSVLGNPERLSELSAAAYESAQQHTPQQSMQKTAEVFEVVLCRPRRR